MPQKRIEIADVFTELESGTLSEQIAERIEKAIVSGAIGQGEALNTDALARQFKVSHIPIREALKTLEAVGLIIQEPNKSARVVELTREDIKDIFEVRKALEGLAVMEATNRLDEPNKQRLQSLVDRMRQGSRSKDYSLILPADKEFHQHIWRVSRNRFLIRGLSNLLLPYFGYLATRGYFLHRNGLDYVPRVHQEVLDAMVGGNGENARQVLAEVHDHSANLMLNS